MSMKRSNKRNIKHWSKRSKINLYSRERLSLEMILRKSLKDTFKEYISNCSLAGVKQVFDPNISLKQRIIWIILFCVMLGTVIYFLRYLWFDTLGKPLIVSMESSTYPISNIDFPAIALCNINRISRKALTKYAREIYPRLAKNNEPFEEVAWFILQAGRLLDYTYNETLRNHAFLDLLVVNRFDNHFVVESMKRIAPDCNEMLIKCVWAGEDLDCMNLFQIRRTGHGHCCAFNYILNYTTGKPNRLMSEAKRQTEPGILHGLSVILDPLLEDYAYPLYNIQGFDVLMFDPTHFADPNGGRVIQGFAEPNMAVLFELQSIKQVATNEVRKYPIQTRKCLFHNEMEEFGDMYSYSACIVKCRIETVQSLCKCTPYFLPNTKGSPICTIEDLRCLNKYREKLLYLYPRDSKDMSGLDVELQDSLFCPDCWPDCELTRHLTKSFKIPLTLNDNTYSGKQFKRNIIGDLNMTNKIILSIYQSTADGILNRLDVVAYWFEVLSNIGGVGGILIGFSIISVVECFYFFIIRFIQIVYSHYQMYH